MRTIQSLRGWGLAVLVAVLVAFMPQGCESVQSIRDEYGGELTAQRDRLIALEASLADLERREVAADPGSPVVAEIERRRDAVEAELSAVDSAIAALNAAGKVASGDAATMDALPGLVSSIPGPVGAIGGLVAGVALMLWRNRGALKSAELGLAMMRARAAQSNAEKAASKAAASAASAAAVTAPAGGEVKA